MEIRFTEGEKVNPLDGDILAETDPDKSGCHTAELGVKVMLATNSHTGATIRLYHYASDGVTELSDSIMIASGFSDTKEIVNLGYMIGKNGGKLVAKSVGNVTGGSKVQAVIIIKG